MNRGKRIHPEVSAWLLTERKKLDQYMRLNEALWQVEKIEAHMPHYTIPRSQPVYSRKVFSTEIVYMHDICIEPCFSNKGDTELFRMAVANEMRQVWLDYFNLELKWSHNYTLHGKLMGIEIRIDPFINYRMCKYIETNIVVPAKKKEIRLCGDDLLHYELTGEIPEKALENG
jgi:hypothetical protein